MTAMIRLFLSLASLLQNGWSQALWSPAYLLPQITLAYQSSLGGLYVMSDTQIWFGQVVRNSQFISFSWTDKECFELLTYYRLVKPQNSWHIFKIQNTKRDWWIHLKIIPGLSWTCPGISSRSCYRPPEWVRFFMFCIVWSSPFLFPGHACFLFSQYKRPQWKFYSFFVWVADFFALR